MLAALLVGPLSGAAGALPLPAEMTAILSGDATLLSPLPGAIVTGDGNAPFANTPSVSADGRHVAFVTNVKVLGLPDGVLRGVVVRDTLTGVATFASVGPGGVPFLAAGAPSIDADGGRIAFTGLPSANGRFDVWVHDLVSSTTVLVSRSLAGQSSDRGASAPSISADGTRVAFQSTSRNLTPDDTDPDADVFVRTLSPGGGGVTVLASVGEDPGVKAHGTESVTISGDGAHVAFSSTSDGLVDGDHDGRSDVFVRDLDATPPTTRLVSDGPPGSTPAEGISTLPALSHDATPLRSSRSEMGTARHRWERYGCVTCPTARARSSARAQTVSRPMPTSRR